ncbi:MAG: CBS domain-containing protein [Promethearchaeota archaeon]
MVPKQTNDSIMKSEGTRLAQLRSEAGLTQQDLAKLVGVSQSYIARMEKGTLDPKHSVVARAVNAIDDHVANRRMRGLFEKTKCGGVMTADPITVDARDPVSRAVRAMRDNDFSQVPVLRGSAIVGIISELDILEEIHHDLSQMSVQAVMSSEDPPIVSENAPVSKIIPLLLDYPAVLVQSRGRLMGIITRADIIKLKE